MDTNGNNNYHQTAQQQQIQQPNYMGEQPQFRVSEETNVFKKVQQKNDFELFELGFKVIDKKSLKNTGDDIDTITDEGEELMDYMEEQELDAKGKKKKKKGMGCCAVLRKKNAEEGIDYWQD